MADSDNDSGGVGNNGSSGEERHMFLPMANVDRIMRKALPANAMIAMDAKEAVQECVSEFIHLITGEASKKCEDEKRKTINGDDLLEAMETLGFDEYINPLQLYQQKFREFKIKKQGTHTGAPGDGGSASSSLSQPVNVGGSHGAGLYGSSAGGAGSGGSGMMGQHQHQQHQLGSSFFRGSGSSSGGSSSPSGRQGRI